MAKRGYLQANKDWLEAKAKEEGVTAHYTGKTINGKTFVSKANHTSWFLFITSRRGQAF